MNKNILDKIEGLKYSVSDEYNEITSNVNSLTTDTYNTISKSLDDVTNIKNKISVISDMFTDLRVLNGTAKNMVYLSTLPVVENNGIKVKDDKFTLDTLIKNNKEIYVKESSISSVDNYKLYTLDGKGTTLDTFLKSGIETLVQFDNTRYTFTLNLRYSTVEQINSIDLQLGLLTESYPIVNSIKYVDKDNVERTAVILNNTSTSYDLDYNREVDNKYTLDISPILTNQINIELTSKTNSSIILKNIKTYFKKEAEAAEIIVGPIHTEKPLLKVALDCEELSKGCSFELSTDLEYWLKLDSSSIITDELNTKILSFNTINEKSIKTTEDIYTFYIKISIESFLLTNDDVDVNLYNTLREDHSINNDTLELVDDNLFSTYKVKSSDFIHGQYQYIENLNIKDLSIENIEYLEVNGNSKVLGLIDTPYSITDKTENTSGGIGGELKLKRLPASFIIDSTKYDLANSKVYDIFLRDIEDTINTREKDNLCLTLKRTKKIETILSNIVDYAYISFQSFYENSFIIINGEAYDLSMNYDNLLSTLYEAGLGIYNSYDSLGCFYLHRFQNLTNRNLEIELINTSLLSFGTMFLEPQENKTIRGSTEGSTYPLEEGYNKLSFTLGPNRDFTPINPSLMLFNKNMFNPIYPKNSNNEIYQYQFVINDQEVINPLDSSNIFTIDTPEGMSNLSSALLDAGVSSNRYVSGTYYQLSLFTETGKHFKLCIKQLGNIDANTSIWYDRGMKTNTPTEISYEGYSYDPLDLNGV